MSDLNVYVIMASDNNLNNFYLHTIHFTEKSAKKIIKQITRDISKYKPIFRMYGNGEFPLQVDIDIDNTKLNEIIEIGNHYYKIQMMEVL